MKRSACGLATIGFLLFAGCLPYGSYRDDPDAGDWRARHGQVIPAGGHDGHGKDRSGPSQGSGDGHERPGGGNGHDGKPGHGGGGSGHDGKPGGGAGGDGHGGGHHRG